MNKIVNVSGLRVVARNAEGDDIPIVHGADFTVSKGEVVALIGESGSGKTTIALSLMGYARNGCRIAGGSIRIGEVDILKLGLDELAELRGRTVSYIAQSAAAAFNPSKTIMDQVIESALIHKTMPRKQAEAKAVQLFRELALPDPEGIGSRYPHQVSGGQLQRLMAAMALITDPAVVVLDEPTTALDVTTQIEVLRAFKNVVRKHGATAVYVSHDLSVVAQMADHIIVLHNGQIQEYGSTDQILKAPTHPYTRSLLAAMEHSPLAATANLPPEHDDVILEVRDLAVRFGNWKAGEAGGKLVLQDIDLKIRRGSTVGVIGESGSGKTTLARAIAGLVAPSSGQVLLNGQTLAATLEGRTRDQFRRVQYVFQNADTALNPQHSIETILSRPLKFYHGMSGQQRRKRVAELLDLVRLPSSVAQRRPGELSGGQKQRVSLSRALAAEPELLLCDEVTSALDTVVGAAILELIAELRRELNVSFMFISHDLGVVRSICDEIVVLYAGRKVEVRQREAQREPPFHPYSHLLDLSIPMLRRGWLEEVGGRAAATLPALSSFFPASPASLCPFIDRCSMRVDALCNTTPPPMLHLSNGSHVLCHRTEEELMRVQQPLKLVAGEAA